MAKTYPCPIHIEISLVRSVTAACHVENQFIGSIYRYRVDSCLSIIMTARVQQGIIKNDRVGVGWTSGVIGGKKSEVGITYLKYRSTK